MPFLDWLVLSMQMAIPNQTSGVQFLTTPLCHNLQYAFRKDCSTMPSDGTKPVATKTLFEDADGLIDVQTGCSRALSACTQSTVNDRIALRAITHIPPLITAIQLMESILGKRIS